MLLRFLQKGEVRPVGSTETSRVDVRVIAATHRDLEAAVESGAFREDLYYRLRRVVLEVPPLRARREDIALLVEHFRGEVNERAASGSPSRASPRQAMASSRRHWPGNVRELEAVLKRAMVLRRAGWVTPEDLVLGRSPAKGPQPRLEWQGGRNDSEHGRADLGSARGPPDSSRQRRGAAR